MSVLTLVGCGAQRDPVADAWLEQLHATDGLLESVEVSAKTYVGEKGQHVDTNDAIVSSFVYRADGNNEWVQISTARNTQEFIAIIDTNSEATFVDSKGFMDYQPEYEMASIISEISNQIPIPSRVPMILNSVISYAASGSTRATGEVREIDGANCTQYEIVADSMGFPATFHVYADETLGGTPRVIERIDEADGEVLNRFTFEEFREIDDGIWLPMRLRARSHNNVDKRKWSESLVVVESWKVNEEFSTDAFVIPKP